MKWVGLGFVIFGVVGMLVWAGRMRADEFTDEEDE